MKRSKATSPVIHLICNAHLDPVWKWEWEEGLTEALSTFETAADLLEEDPDLVFNHNESLLYEWVLDYRPDLFKRIQKLVHSGRWHISGGWYLQPDCNLPEGECFVRHILIGRQFFRTHFGAEPEIAYNFDAFGHHGNLPQILRKAGYRGYIHFRPAAVDLDLPADLYQWEGIDGSRVLAYRPPFVWYGTDDHKELQERIEATVAGKIGGGGPVGIFWGMGDHGGGATREDLKVIRAMQKRHPQVQHSTTDKLLVDFEAVAPKAPVWKGDLQRVFTGCYTSVSATKQSNRRSEFLVQQAERYSAAAWWLLRRPYPANKLTRIWKDVLFNQFHDILPGSSTRRGMQCSYEIAGRAMKEAREVTLDAQLALMAKKSPRSPLTVVVFNPHPHSVRMPIDLEYMVGHRPILSRYTVARITDAAGRSVPCQDEMPGAVATRFDWRKRVVFDADLPAFAQAEFQIHLDTKPDRPKPRPKKSADILFKNAHYWILIDSKTGLVRDLGRTKRAIVRQPAGWLGVFADSGDAWGTDVKKYDKMVGKFRLAKPNEASNLTGQLHLGSVEPVRIIEDGPVRTVVECLFVYKRSTAAVRYFLYQDRPEISAEIRVHWNEPRLQLKWIWPTSFQKETYCAEIPYGDITRRQGEGEHTHLRWLGVADSSSGDALGLAGIGPSGHDVRNGEIRITLLRSAVYCHGSMHPLREDIFHDFMDLGESRFQFSLLLTGENELRPAMTRLTQLLALPPTALVHYPLGASANDGQPAGHSFLSLEGEGVELGAVKCSEDGRDLILRIVERSGREARAKLSIARLTKPLDLHLAPYEIRTLRVSRKGSVRECDLLERPLNLSNRR